MKLPDFILIRIEDSKILYPVRTAHVSKCWRLILKQLILSWIVQLWNKTWTSKIHRAHLHEVFSHGFMSGKVFIRRVMVATNILHWIGLLATSSAECWWVLMLHYRLVSLKATLIQRRRWVILISVLRLRMNWVLALMLYRIVVLILMLLRPQIKMRFRW